MKILKFILIASMIFKLNGCLLTVGLVKHATKKKTIMPTSSYSPKGAIISTYANKNRTKYLINFKASHNAKIKNYRLIIDKNEILKKLPKQFVNTHFEKKTYYSKKIYYKFKNGNHLYNVDQFKKKSYKLMKDDITKINYDEFEEIDPIINEYIQGKSRKKREMFLIKQLNDKHPIGIIKDNKFNKFVSNPNIYVKIDLHENQNNEILKFNLMQSYKKPFNLMTLIFTPASIATDIVTFPVQVIIALSFFRYP